MSDKGILKHGELDSAADKRLRWDEDNLQITEATRGGKMKVTEPKTPFIHYDPLNDKAWVRNAATSDELDALDLDLGPAQPSRTEAIDQDERDALSEDDSADLAGEAADVPHQLVADDGDAPDPWAEEEEAEEAQMSAEKRAAHEEFAQHRKDFYRIDPALLRRPIDVEDEEDDGPGGGPADPEENEDSDNELEDTGTEDDDMEDTDRNNDNGTTAEPGRLVYGIKHETG
ncbi:hypothetical protein DFJ74DRAFT_510457 [Hyaloraphidium curvatum]|nr:hypothetical protein DFJ74DRAFT_510457 [Hyaloraphidium curvatum]